MPQRTVYSSIHHKIQKVGSKSKCPETDEWVNKMWYIHTVEYYSALIMKEILTHAVNG